MPYVSTFEFHQDRERAPHLEQQWHQGRLHKALEYATTLADGGPLRISDLGCGDGGLLSLLQQLPGATAWGYDFAPANAAGWAERGVTAYAADVFGSQWDSIEVGHLAVMTEVLEHLADPHGVLKRLRGRAAHLVCSSPWNESRNNHCAEHAWAWDLEGYAAMIEAAGWRITRHEQVGFFQVVLAQ